LHLKYIENVCREIFAGYSVAVYSTALKFIERTDEKLYLYNHFITIIHYVLFLSLLFLVKRKKRKQMVNCLKNEYINIIAHKSFHAVMT